MRFSFHSAMNIAAKDLEKPKYYRRYFKEYDKQCRGFLQDRKGKNNNLYNFL